MDLVAPNFFISSSNEKFYEILWKTEKLCGIKIELSS